MLPPASDGEHPHTPVVSEQQPPYQQSATHAWRTAQLQPLFRPTMTSTGFHSHRKWTYPNHHLRALRSWLSSLRWSPAARPRFYPTVHCGWSVAFLSTCTCSGFFGVAYFSCFSTCNRFLSKVLFSYLMGFPLWSAQQYCETNLICVEPFAVFFSFQCKVFRQNQHTIEQLVTRTILRLFCRKIDRITFWTPLDLLRYVGEKRAEGGVRPFAPVNLYCLSDVFFQVGLGPGLYLKLHPGVCSSRNSMKVLTARTDVSYLRDYKTGGEEGYAGRFCAFRVFLFFSNPASPLSPVHSLCLSVGYAGLPLVLRV